MKKFLLTMCIALGAMVLAPNAANAAEVTSVSKEITQKAANGKIVIIIITDDEIIIIEAE